jgi:hypothetical protein
MPIHELPNPFNLAFVLLPIWMLYRYYLVNHKPPIKVWFLVFTFFGWLCINAGFWWHQYWLAIYIDSFNGNPPETHVAELTGGDGARLIFTFLLGWVYAAAYFGIIAGIARAIRVVTSRRKRLAKTVK